MLRNLILALLAATTPDWTPSENEAVLSLYKPKPYEPQTPAEADLAKRALQHRKGGDMILPKRQQFGSIWRYTANRWPGYPGSAKVPYVIDKSVPAKQHDLIKRAMEQYNKLSCVKFVSRKKEKDYINIFKGNDGCWSYVGKKGGKQDLSLDDGCYYIGTIVHELGHALGFLHEHQRHDREDFIAVYTDNITAGYEDQFFRTPTEDEIIASTFDYNSIMIYGNYAFSKDKTNLMTMEAHNRVQLTEPFNKPGLDNTDIYAVKVMYQCKN